MVGHLKIDIEELAPGSADGLDDVAGGNRGRDVKHPRGLGSCHFVQELEGNVAVTVHLLQNLEEK